MGEREDIWCLEVVTAARVFQFLGTKRALEPVFQSYCEDSAEVVSTKITVKGFMNDHERAPITATFRTEVIEDMQLSRFYKP